MKIKVMMKCPDAVVDAIERAVSEQCDNEGITDMDVHWEVTRNETERITKLAEKWFKYGEYVTLVIDTEKETCEVEVV